MYARRKDSFFIFSLFQKQKSIKFIHCAPQKKTMKILKKTFCSFLFFVDFISKMLHSNQNCIWIWGRCDSMQHVSLYFSSRFVINLWFLNKRIFDVRCTYTMNKYSFLLYKNGLLVYSFKYSGELHLTQHSENTNKNVRFY